MPNSMTLREDHALSQVQAHRPTSDRRKLGRVLLVAGSLGFAAIFLLQALDAAGIVALGFSNWRPVLYGFLLWAVTFACGVYLGHAPPLVS